MLWRFSSVWSPLFGGFHFTAYLLICIYSHSSIQTAVKLLTLTLTNTTGDKYYFALLHPLTLKQKLIEFFTV
jgi:hypothetical protein